MQTARRWKSNALQLFSTAYMNAPHFIYCLYSHSTDEQTEVQWSDIPCPGTLVLLMVESVFYPKQTVFCKNRFSTRSEKTLHIVSGTWTSSPSWVCLLPSHRVASMNVVPTEDASLLFQTQLPVIGWDLPPSWSVLTHPRLNLLCSHLQAFISFFPENQKRRKEGRNSKASRLRSHSLPNPISLLTSPPREACCIEKLTWFSVR